MNSVLWQFAALAQQAEEHVSRSWVQTYFYSAGLLFGVAIPLVSLLACVFAATLLATVNRRWVFVFPLLASFLPLIVGLVGTVVGMIAAFSVISSSHAQPKASEVAEGINMALYTTVAGAVLCVPPFLLSLAGLIWKGPRRA